MGKFIHPTGDLHFHRCLVIVSPRTQAYVIWTHTLCSRRQCMVNPCCILFSSFFLFFHFTVEPPMRWFKKYEIVLEDEIPRSKGTQTVSGEKQGTSTNNRVANGETRPKLEGYLAAGVHKGKKIGQCCTTYTIWTWGGRNMNQGKLEIVKKEIEQLKHCSAWS